MAPCARHARGAKSAGMGARGVRGPDGFFSSRGCARALGWRCCQACCALKANDCVPTKGEHAVVVATVERGGAVERAVKPDFRTELKDAHMVPKVGAVG